MSNTNYYEKCVDTKCWWGCGGTGLSFFADGNADGMCRVHHELYKEALNDTENHNGVVTHLEPDILECEVKWALGSILTKVVEVMEFQLSYFKS